MNKPMNKVETKSCIIWESPKYREEAEELAKNPIIIQMASEIPEGHDITTYEFFMAFNREYQRRGGKASWSIGGPISALELILARKKGA